MNEELLTRLAETLEGINAELAEMNNTLERLEQNFDNCISRNEKNNFICVTGNISTY